MTDEKNKAENTFHKKIGKTNHKVPVHFSERACGNFSVNNAKKGLL